MDLNGYVNTHARREPNSEVFAPHGGRFQLANPTLALDLVDGKFLAVTIPTGSVVEVASKPTDAGDHLIDVIWEGRTVRMFALDVRERGIEIQASSAEARVRPETTI